MLSLDMACSERTFFSEEEVFSPVENWLFKSSEISSMSPTLDDNRNIVAQIKQGVYHIGEALRIAKVCKWDRFFVNFVSEANHILQQVVRQAADSPRSSNGESYQNCSTASSGWIPMKSQFLGINGFVDRSREVAIIPVGASACKSSSFFSQNATGRSISVTWECKLCDIKCNSELQWKQHTEGHYHQARLAGVHPPKRVKVKDRLTRTPQKTGKFYRTNYASEGRRQNRKNPKFKKHEPCRKRQAGVWLRCGLCDTLCNGKLQYTSHLSGKRHQLAVQRRSSDYA